MATSMTKKEAKAAGASASRSSTAAKKQSQPKAAAAPAKRGRPPGSKNKSNGGAAKSNKTFKLYVAEGDELAFVAEAKGPNGQEAVRRAVANGQTEAGIPIVAISPRNLNPHVVEAIERGVTYKVKPATRRGRPRKAASADGGATAEPKRRGRPPKQKVAPVQEPVAGEPVPTTGSNPFAE